MKETIERLKAARSYEDARAAFLAWELQDKHVDTQETLSLIRHRRNTLDPFYAEESVFWNQALPEIDALRREWTEELTESRFRRMLRKDYGDIMFRNADLHSRTISPLIVDELKEENELTTQYIRLMSRPEIPFEDGVYTLAEMELFKEDPHHGRRFAAWQAEGAWYASHTEELDEWFDGLVEVRDTIGHVMGHDSFVPVGYARVPRNCYSRSGVERYREFVIRYIVPLAERIKREQAAAIGASYPMNYADNALAFPDGNPRPAGSAEELLAMCEQFYNTLSPETGEFFTTMINNDLIDVVPRQGKADGGFCKLIPDYSAPYMMVGLTGTMLDFELLTHMTGNAFAAYLNRERLPMSEMWPTADACGVHSAAMQFFSLPLADAFFGEDAEKYRLAVLADNITFIPYAALVDHFQHFIYDAPYLTPAERCAKWRSLSAIYMPWIAYDERIPFYGEGRTWQRQRHIYASPFYYIDYALSRTVALHLFTEMQEDEKGAFDKYLTFTSMGGTRTFTELLAEAGLPSPFEEAQILELARRLSLWLDRHMAGKENT